MSPFVVGWTLNECYEYILMTMKHELNICWLELTNVKTTFTVFYLSLTKVFLMVSQLPF